MAIDVIVSVLPPHIDGIGDYTKCLWLGFNGLSDKQKQTVGSFADWRCLVVRGRQESANVWPDVEIKEFGTSRAALLQALANAGDSNMILLEYCGYAFDRRRGAPLWLSEGLKEWKAGAAGRKIATMFHETWVRGFQPWRRSYWHSFSQRRCARELMEISDLSVTSNQRYQELLQELMPGRAVKVIPIGCNFEVDRSKLPDKNWRSLLILGQARLYCIRDHAPLIKEMARQKLIDRIVLAGSCSSSDPAFETLKQWNLNVEIETAYNFKSDALPDSVLSCGLALSKLPSTYLQRSSSFQLAMALGQVAVAIEKRPAGEDLLPGVHYLSYNRKDLANVMRDLADPEKLKSVSAAAGQVSENFKWQVLARRWSDLLEII